MADRLTEVRLGPYTTLRVGGPARAFIEARTQDELVAVVSEADREGEPVLILGGGSNLVVSDEGFDGLVVHVSSRGVDVADHGGRVVITVQAGEDWDDLVARCVAEGWSGLECLSGVPGLVGSTPIQNVGAYGQDVSQTITGVRVYDRMTGEINDLTAAECGFAYRNSAFKDDPGRHVVLAVTYALERSDLSGPVAYKELADRLGVEAGARMPLADVREAVLGLRRGKGMVLDPADPDTRSAGSFFTNPVLSAAQAAELELRAPGHPRWDMPDGSVKVPAAWLIEHAGFPKGYERGAVRISTKHTLALTNPSGQASAQDLLALAREVREGVVEKFGVTLVNEPVLVGIAI
ncbi:UDP-N-acetylmuramate dehydrogenase [Planotetraspora kaengkrachanensis]|uniref:UDP-N-acetylenolpyruvoylglucosamine reductase n=1 Tax=Planotetraspora kaengkrachanensis TaxID=575193 RepID=A0A8J3LVG5_9ACTN|nr:UDP-N-acetylmuramate dehydrogenase [Planotetraspora kaengkrachanensis]GIG78524.1 UDP-N-acetylenolpyruvoylglucosamine reductase [Planotetraspora kaengkrachanensis]